MMREPIVAGNWKMHLGVAAATAFCEDILNEELPDGVQAVVCPPFTSLPAAAMMLAGSPIGLGAQNVHWEASGAFTAEVAAPMLTELGVEWAVVGHSERRAMFCETDQTAHRRAAAAQQEELTVIFCVGETLEEREAGATFSVLERQAAALEDLDTSRLVVAYEPVWAIGTGRTASPEQAQEAHAFLRGRLRALFGDAADGLRILYGGSVKPANAAKLFAQNDVDGGLVGGASLDVASFSAIIRAAAMSAAKE